MRASSRGHSLCPLHTVTKHRQLTQSDDQAKGQDKVPGQGQKSNAAESSGEMGGTDRALGVVRQSRGQRARSGAGIEQRRKPGNERGNERGNESGSEGGSRRRPAKPG